jgi:hypothetical protein
MTEAKESSIFEHLGGKLIHVPDHPHVKSADLRPAYGATGRFVYTPPESEESKDEEVGTDE